MRIGLPNILPLFAFLFFGTISVATTTLFFDEVDTAETGETMFNVVSMLLSYAMLGLFGFRFKVVAMTRDKLVIILPFRLSIRSFTYDKIENLKWDLWGIHRLGNYRKLAIQAKSDFRTNISDFEFINYDSLEKWLMEHVQLEFNLDRKTSIEVQQAKYNKWVNVLAILVVGFFTFLIATGRNDNKFRTVILVVLILILLRVSVKLIHYQQRINESRQRREDWKRKTSR